MFSPNEKTPKYECVTCGITCNKQSDWMRHVSTNKHKTLSDILNSGNEKAQQICTACNKHFSTKYELKKHNETKYHANKENNAIKTFGCIKCNKIYSSYHSLWQHKRRCSDKQSGIDATALMIEVIKSNGELQKQNMELQKQMLELCKNKVPTTVTNNNIKNENKSFNVNIFLNDQCKDAINFSDFVKNIEISREDLENTAQLGFVSGVSKILMDNLKQLGINERPIHCTDAKRETMYIKEENKWTKEVDDSKLQKAIQTVSCKSMKTLQEWKKENPEYQDADSAFSLRCLDMQKHAIAGSDREVYYPKVIHVLARETMIDK